MLNVEHWTIGHQTVMVMVMVIVMVIVMTRAINTESRVVSRHTSKFDSHSPGKSLCGGKEWFLKRMELGLIKFRIERQRGYKRSGHVVQLFGCSPQARRSLIR